MPQLQIKLKPISTMTFGLRIVGTSPLIQHCWSEKAKREIREKQAGKKSKNREARDPEKEGREAAYYTADGKYGVPCMAIKAAIISAAHKDIGLEKTAVRKSLFMKCDDPNGVLPMDCDEPEFREDCVRIGQGGTDLRYRPYFFRWSVDISVTIDREWMQLDDLLNLIDRAGFGVGIGEWRPEKGGEFGRFEVDRSFPVTGVHE